MSAKKKQSRAQSGAGAAGREGNEGEIILSDMAACQPASALSRDVERGQWRMFDYESAEMSGTMLLVEPLADAPNVHLPLDVQGWHAIHVGYMYPQLNERTQIKVKLSSDPCFTSIADRQEDEMDTMTLREVFWKHADLTGEQVVFGQQTKGVPRAACVAYLRLVPLSRDQVEQVLADRADTSTRTIISSNDGGSFMTTKAPTEKEDIWEQIEPYRYSDVGRLDWAVCYGDMTNYPSKVGCNYFEERYRTHFNRPSSTREISSTQTLIGKGLVPYKVAMEYAHDIGIEFHLMFRMGIAKGWPLTAVGGGLYANHPELRQVARDGTPLPNLSYAFDEVADCMLGIIRESVTDDVDGINLCWIRGAPYIGYEKPVADAFAERYGRDITSVADDDERLCRLRAEYLTAFMRRVRELADEVGQRRGRPLPVTVMLPASLSRNLYHGYDTKTWAEEHLVDAMIAAAIHTQYLHSLGIKEYMSLTSTGLMASVVTRAESGADGIFVWDMNCDQDFVDRWTLLRQLGHTEQVIDGKSIVPEPRRIKLKTLDGDDVEHTYYWGGGDNRALMMYMGG